MRHVIGVDLRIKTNRVCDYALCFLYPQQHCVPGCCDTDAQVCKYSRGLYIAKTTHEDMRYYMCFRKDVPHMLCPVLPY